MGTVDPVPRAARLEPGRGTLVDRHGLAFGVFTGMLFLLFSQGVDLSIGSPIIRTGGIVIAATLGILVFRETLNLRYVLGFSLAAIGIYLVATR